MEEFLTTTEHKDIEDRFSFAQLDQSTFRNCAGFTKYMLGLTDQETLTSPDELAKELNEVKRITLDMQNPTNITQETYLTYSTKSNAIALFVEIAEVKEPKNLAEITTNFRAGKKYVHFAFIDPNDPLKIYQRPDLEKHPMHTGWRDALIDLKDFEGMKKGLVFFSI